MKALDGSWSYLFFETFIAIAKYILALILLYVKFFKNIPVIKIKS